MRKYGLLFTIIGFLVIALSWNVYSSHINVILSLDKIYIFLILTLGLILTLISGILIGIGIKIMINPQIYDKMKALIKE